MGYDEITNRPNKVLLVNLGRVHDDRDEIAAELRNKGFDVQYLNLKEQGFETLDFSNVAAVDLRGCRGWQQDVTFFKEQLSILEKKIPQTGHKIPVFNPPEMFYWADSKEYLDEIKQQGVDTVPTLFIRSNDAWPDILDLIERSPSKRIVLKPAVASRATNLFFVTKITKIPDGEYEITSPKPRADSPTSHVITVTPEVLEIYMKGYRQKMFEGEHQPAVLIQDYCEGIEISAVFVGDIPHFIKRTKTDDNRVAHEDYGGTNSLYSPPATEVLELARKVRNGLPDRLKRPPYLRVDMLWDGVSAPKLLEIEAGSARLFLREEKDGPKKYADMIHKQIVQSRTPHAESGKGREIAL